MPGIAGPQAGISLKVGLSGRKAEPWNPTNLRRFQTIKEFLMKAEYVNDPVKGPGYALLLIDGIGRPENPRCVMKRSSDGKTLGRGGWSRAGHDMPCRGIQPTDGGFALSIGPEVVDDLDALESYRLMLRCPDGGEFVCSLSVFGIVYSPQTGVGGVAEAVDASGFSPARDAGGRYSRMSEGDPDASGFSPARDAGAEEPEAASLRADGNEGVLTLDDVVPHEEPGAAASADAPPPLPKHPAGGKRRMPQIFIPALLLLTCAAGILAMQFNKPKNDAPPALQTAAGPASSVTGAVAPDAPDTTQGAGQADNAGLLGRARGHLAGKADPDVSLALYRRLRTEANGADAAFLLAEDAAQKGLPEAMLIVAGYYDPLVAGDKGSINHDEEEAFNWYTKAEQAGAAEAAPRLAALKERIAAEAAGGDREAERLLKRFSR
jgi:hypothetical protein